jgi:F-type H+-transporting ATPase subunit alpha
MFRALEAFAKFGSDLDKSTQQQLTRGARLTEIMKQRQYSPVTVDKQIALIFCATNGFLDELPAETIGRFQDEFFEIMDLQHADLLNDIKTKKEVTADTNAKLMTAIGKIVENFKRTI